MSDANFLTGIEHVRKRPGMYFGWLDSRGLNFVINYMLENIIDQARTGKANQLTFTLVAPQQFQIEDDGAGIPVREHQSTGISVLETIVTIQGGRHYNEGTDKFDGGMFGTGLATINAVSSEMLVEVKRDSFLWQQTYSRGKPTSPLTKVRALHPDESKGTKIVYTVDTEIFGDSAFDSQWIIRRLEDIAFLCGGLRVTFVDLIADHKTTFFYPNGTVDYLAKLNRGLTPVHDPIVIREKVQVNPDNSRSILEIDLAFQFVEENEGMLVNFVNEKEAPDAGIQLDILHEWLSNKFLVWLNHHSADAFIGLVVVFSVRYPRPESSVTLGMVLKNENIKQPLNSSIIRALDDFEISKPDQFQKIIEYVNRNRDRRLARRYQ